MAESSLDTSSGKGVSDATAEDVFVFPLSFAQQRLWFIDQLEPESGAYNMPSALRLRGTLNLAALERTLDEIVRRHEILRTTFDLLDGEPVQMVAPFRPVTLPVVDLSALDATRRAAEAKRLADAEAHHRFNLATDSLFRMKLLRLAPEENLLLLTMHHIISDGWSMDVLFQEIATLYAAFDAGASSPLAELPIQYADYAVWQREWLSGEALQTQLAYWKKQLADAPAVLEIPTDCTRPPKEDSSGAMRELTLPARLTMHLRELSRSEGATLFMTMLAAFKILLARHSGQRDIVVGTPIAGRQMQETESLIGLFLNTLALRTNLSGEPSFIELLRRVREVALGAYAHQDVPFERLVEELQPERDLARHPIFDVMFNFINASRQIQSLPGLVIDSPDPGWHEAKFALTLYVFEEADGLRLQLSYRRALFSEARIVAMLNQYVYLLEQLAASPENSIETYTLVTPDALRILPDPAAPLAEPHYETVMETFLRRAEAAPQQTAISRGERAWSYLELAERARAIATILLAQGQERGDVVAVSGQRSFGLVASMLAVMMSGGVLLLVDPKLPFKRRQLMLREAGAKWSIRISDGARDDELHLETQPASARIEVDPETGRVLSGSEIDELDARRLPVVSPDDAAYIFFTSGTTGIPKGVLGCHKGLSHFLAWQRTTFEVGAGDRIGQLTGLSFDVVLRDIFLPLTSGATLCLPPADDDSGADSILPWLEREEISLLHTVPALARSWLLGVPEGVSLRALRRVFFAGEPLTDSLVHRWRAAFPASGDIVNLYGPTETTLAKCFYLVPAEPRQGVQPVGWPLDETQGLVLAANNRLCGVGEAGEIVVRTPFRTLGYINAGEEDRERFFVNPFRPSPPENPDLLYRTGDRGRYLPDGSLEILGRLDQQLKIRGLRIEPAEIEKALSEHEAVAEAVVVGHADASGTKSLVAYVVLKEDAGARPGVGELRSFLREQLPEYMIPSAFVMLDALPLTANGKLDRRALPAPEQARERVAITETPCSPLEEALASIWSEVLGLEQIGRHENFFEAGGHSLLATQVMTRVRAAFAVEIPLRRLFEHPTVAGLAATIQQAIAGGDRSADAPIVRVPRRDEGMPLSFAQQRLWFLDRLEPGRATYNIPLVVRLRGELNFDALEQSFAEVVRRHETLRTSFGLRDGQPVQLIETTCALELACEDLRSLSLTEREDAVSRRAKDEAQRAFDLSRNPVWRARLLRLAEDEHVLLFTMHHIVSDAWSLDVLMREVSMLYAAFTAGKPSPLAELPVQYADFAVWQRAWLAGEVLDAQLSYWKKMLAGAPEVLELPLDKPRPPVQSFNGATLAAVLPEALKTALRALSRRAGATMFMTLLAAFNVLLRRYSRQDDLLVGTPIAGRGHAETEGLIGFFVNTLVLRTDMSGNPSFEELVARVREIALGAYAHQELPFERLVEELKPQRSLAHAPLFQVGFGYQPERAGTLPQPSAGLSLDTVDVHETTAKFDLVMNISESKTGLTCFLNYNTDLFDQSTIKRMLDHFRILLENIVRRPDQPVSEISLLDDDERRRILVEWNDTAKAFPSEHCVHQLFEARAKMNPDAIALVFGNRRVSYGDLNRRANQLAHLLRRAGVGAESVVGLCVERSIEMVVGVLGILKAGGAYLPLDPSHPVERLDFILQDAEAGVVLTQDDLRPRLRAYRGRVVSIDAAREELDAESDAAPRCDATPRNLAYLIYTSGSTGTPKGVAVEHRGLCNLATAQIASFGLHHESRVLQFASPSFDASVSELFTTLLTGGTLYLAEREALLPGTPLLQLLQEHAVTTVTLVPSALAVLPVAELPALETLVVAGEDCPLEVARPWAVGRNFFNAYGPTEATVCATLARPRDLERRLPIGKPIDNVHVYLLDEHLRPVPVGVTGELYIGGAGLARGYHRRPHLTAESFLPHPFATEAGARLYRTGDMARYLAGGEIEYLGRGDAQVKVRGYRIELGEIEAALRLHPAVRDALVTTHEAAGGERRLAAYVVSREPLANDDLRGFLQQRLPEYMIPPTFVCVEELPLTPHGKFDRRALPPPSEVRAKASGSLRVARDRLELQLVHIWEELLGLPSVDLHDDFFELGGHSLLAVRLHTRIEQVCGQKLQLADLFRASTVESLAKLLRRGERTSDLSPLVPIQPHGARPPFYCVHPAGGNVFCYLELSRQLGREQPFYGLEARGLDGQQKPHTHVEAMAADYNQAIRTVQPTGPYLLGGWSIGGVIAFEMARQLQTQGETVALLALFDSKAPSPSPKSAAVPEAGEDNLSLMADFARHLGLPLESLTLDPKEFMRLQPSLQLATLLGHARDAKLFPTDVDVERLQHLLDVYLSNIRAVENYRPLSPDLLRLLLFRAADEPARDAADPALGWNKISTASITVEEIPGNHFTIINAPHVATLAEKLRSHFTVSLRELI